MQKQKFFIIFHIMFLVDSRKYQSYWSWFVWIKIAIYFWQTSSSFAFEVFFLTENKTCFFFSRTKEHSRLLKSTNSNNVVRKSNPLKGANIGYHEEDTVNLTWLLSGEVLNQYVLSIACLCDNDTTLTKATAVIVF